LQSNGLASGVFSEVIMATGKDKEKEKDVKLDIVVNGTPVQIKGDPDDALVSLLAPALEKAGVAGGADLTRWVFKDKDGNVLDKNQKLADFDFAKHARVFLSLEAGVAG
jgi:hypothetical protein